MILEAENIKKGFSRGHKQVLNGVNFQAESGECIGILGKNGCGKTTLLSILAGIQKADEGSFRIDGQELLNSRKERGKRIGYVPQDNPLMEELSAWDNLRLWYEGDREGLQQEVDEGVLGMLGIPEF